MNVNGVLGSLCCPSLPGFAGHNFLKYKDRGAGLAAVRAYNDWHFEDWCSPYADRFIPMAVVPLWDGQLAAAEMERMARRGVPALTFPDNPTRSDERRLGQECVSKCRTWLSPEHVKQNKQD